MTTLAFVGDVMLSRGVESFHENSDLPVITAPVRKVLEQADFSVCNLEGPISDAPEKNGPFGATKKMLRKAAAFDLFGLANNHSLDRGKAGIFETIIALQEIGLNWTGVQIAREFNHFATTIKGERFLFISATSSAFPLIRKQSSDLPYVQTLEDKSLTRFIAEAKGEHDHIICLIHGGVPLSAYPEPEFRARCQSLVKAGAALVLTSHPHVLGGYEKHLDGHIFYSLGDFIFDNGSFLPRHGAILLFNFSDKSARLVPTTIDWSFQVQLSQEKERRKSLRRWMKVSKALQDPEYDRHFNTRYRKSIIQYEIDRLYYRYKSRGLPSALALVFQTWRPVPPNIIRLVKRKHDGTAS